MLSTHSKKNTVLCILNNPSFVGHVLTSVVDLGLQLQILQLCIEIAAPEQANTW